MHSDMLKEMRRDILLLVSLQQPRPEPDGTTAAQPPPRGNGSRRTVASSAGHAPLDVPTTAMDVVAISDDGNLEEQQPQAGV